MKQILIFLSILFSLLALNTQGQCIDNAGHVQGDIDSIHINTCEWFIDTSYVRVARLEYDAYEYSVYPDGCDTTFFSCVRCDSFVAEPSAEIRRFIRALGNQTPGAPPEPEASYKVYTALLTQTGTSAPTATVLENTIGTITWTYTDYGFYTGTCTGCFTENKTFAYMYNIFQNLNGLYFNWFDVDRVVISGDADYSEGTVPMRVEIRVYP
jgi:hypothetical protein